MDTGFTAEQDEIRRTLRELLHKRSGPEELRAAVDTPAGHDPALWTALAEQLGLPGLALPEAYGGVGCTPTELALACEELGRTLTPTPLLATAALAAPLILALGTEAQRTTLLPRITSGTLTATLAAPTTALALTGDNHGDWAGGGRAGGVQARRVEGGGRAGGETVSAPSGVRRGDVAGGEAAPAPSGGSPGDLAVGGQARRAESGRRLCGETVSAPSGVRRGDSAGGGRAGGEAASAPSGDSRGDLAVGGQARRPESRWRLYGEVAHVLDGHSAGVLLVAAHSGGFARSRTDLFLVRADAAGVVRARQTALDSTRPQGRVQLRDVEAELLGDEGADVPGVLARLGDTVAAVLACEAVGAADRVLELTVEYVKQREQFGRPVGSFQAVKHRLADVYVQVQAARSAAYYAAWATAHRETVGGLALAQALEALRTAAGEAIQLHGGIGFTWEHQAHLYFKRAAGDELLFGPVHRLRAHAADAARLFLEPEVAV
ncbi:acyl-CoA dehydrogenase family protein [Streptomyces sp. NPDC050803]|uniref:acyl-CoA dehydrogenase family protein n=1 Tax=unclassified Streptomyces TaxID=2593676 RepID=UPI003447C17A